MKEKKTTKICKHCQSEIPAKAKICPVCKKKQGMKTWQAVLIVFLALVLIGGLAGGSGSKDEAPTQSDQVVENETNTTTEEPKEEKQEKYTIEGDITESKDKYSLNLEGILRNNTDRDLNYIQISFNVYDKDGNLLGTALDNANHLKAGGTWKFKAVYFSSDNEADHWELAEVSGF